VKGFFVGMGIALLIACGGTYLVEPAFGDGAKDGLFCFFIGLLSVVAAGGWLRD
jgi:hypothetical protein